MSRAKADARDLHPCVFVGSARQGGGGSAGATNAVAQMANECRCDYSLSVHYTT